MVWIEAVSWAYLHFYKVKVDFSIIETRSIEASCHPFGRDDEDRALLLVAAYTFA